MFSKVFSSLQNMGADDNIDENKVQKDHEQAYGNANSGNMSANALGSAAALQAFKQFTSGNSNAASGGGDFKSKVGDTFVAPRSWAGIDASLSAWLFPKLLSCSTTTEVLRQETSRLR